MQRPEDTPYKVIVENSAGEIIDLTDFTYLDAAINAVLFARARNQYNVGDRIIIEPNKAKKEDADMVVHHRYKEANNELVIPKAYRKQFIPLSNRSPDALSSARAVLEAVGKRTYEIHVPGYHPDELRQLVETKRETPDIILLVDIHRASQITYEVVMDLICHHENVLGLYPQDEIKKLAVIEDYHPQLSKLDIVGHQVRINSGDLYNRIGEVTEVRWSAQQRTWFYTIEKLGDGWRSSRRKEGFDLVV